ncbi:MAG: hypothetical protein WCR20_21975 [Verrucomicrobiota bacterium]
MILLRAGSCKPRRASNLAVIRSGLDTVRRRISTLVSPTRTGDTTSIDLIVPISAARWPAQVPSPLPFIHISSVRTALHRKSGQKPSSSLGI